MNRPVVVSNRVTPVSDSKAATAGGLAVGLLAALRESGGIWFGWSGQIADAAEPQPKVLRAGNITFITINLSQADFDGYYGRFANRTLWPLFHYRLDLANFDRETFTSPIVRSTDCSPNGSFPICAAMIWSGSTIII